MIYAVFDIGGTNTRVAVTDDLEKLSKKTSFKTPETFSAGVKAITGAIDKLTDEKPVAIAGGIRGPLNEEKTGIVNDTKLEKWVGESVVAALQKHYDVPVTLENDAAIAGLGEAVYGAGEGLEIVAYHTVSTGVGGVKIENSAVDLASVGFEPGHQVLDIDRTILGEETVPTLENLVSGSGVKNRFGVEPYDIPQTDVVWDELAEYLGHGLRNTILYWSPDVIVLGGSMIIGDPRIEIDTIRKYTIEALNGFVEAPFITTATLGDDAGLYGAMVLLKKDKE